MREFVLERPGPRRLSGAATGDPDGFPVVFEHGTPGTRAAHNLSPAAVAGACVVVYDRPGYGGSDRNRGRDVAACAADVAAIADELGLDRFAVFGSSGGGPHALACAALLGERVTAVAVAAGFAPADDPDFDVFDGMSDLNVAELRAAAAGEEALTRLLEAFAESAPDPDAVLDEIARELAQPDRDALGRPEVRVVFRDAIEASLTHGPSGWIDDDLAFMRPWGFEPADVAQPALLVQGELDILVPRGHMARLASQIPRARLEIVPGAGHTLFDRTGEIVAWLLAERGPASS